MRGRRIYRRADGRLSGLCMVRHSASGDLTIGLGSGVRFGERITSFGGR